MADNMEQQSSQQPEMQQERKEIKNPLEFLKTSSEKLAKFGGFDLIESTIEGTQNLNPERKARRNIFLTEQQKKAREIHLKKPYLFGQMCWKTITKSLTW